MEIEEDAEAAKPFYLLSLEWLRAWKAYVCFDEIVAGNDEPAKIFQADHPKTINSDLVKNKTELKEYIFDDSNDKNDPENVVLADNIQENAQYIIVEEATWNLLSKKYRSIEIKRLQHTLENGFKRIEVFYKRFKLILSSQKYLRDVESGNKKLPFYYYQTSIFQTIGEMKKRLAEALTNLNKYDYYSYSRVYPDTIRLWKLSNEKNLETLNDYFYKECNACKSNE
eukprot:TRINITY_DN25824_c0_g1_i1.p1 TRINITY_DN25824_c0_g1~~TRINITY_DN25824_c0_g1_i1.p1  ORF type:complete len:226 (-),score=70.53 TRINITY_DN25824_c0_g1_i1:66-743(-)